MVSNYSKELCYISHNIEARTTRVVKDVLKNMIQLDDYKFHEFKHMRNNNRVDTFFALQGHLILSNIKSIL